jgi:hypothetical protein
VRHRRPQSMSMLRALALSACALGASAAEVSAQVDFLVSAVKVVQSVNNGNTILVGDKPAMVRASIRMTNGSGTVFVDGLCRVYDGGVEIPGSPFFSDNGPFEVVQPINEALLDGTLNFTFVPPVSDDLEIAVEVNPAGPNQVLPEANPNNNVNTQGPFDFVELGRTDMAYAPIDYRPSGGPTPNPPDNELIKPGVGDNFIQGAYPIKDWDYRRIDAPAKLWTSSLSGSGTSLNNSLTADLNLMVPKPEYIYGWVPGSLPYNGQALINGVASMGNTQAIRHQRTFAHEVGHCTGLFHINSTTGLIGVDVEHHLAITQALPKIKPTNAFDIMVAGLLTNQAWVYVPNHNHFANHPKFQSGIGAAPMGGDDLGDTLFVGGIWNSATGEVTFSDMFAMPASRPSEPAASGSSEVVLRAYAGGALVRELAVAAVSSDDCAARGVDEVSPLVGFTANLPLRAANGAAVDMVEVRQGGDRLLGTTVIERSPNAPEVAFTSPASGTLGGTQLTVAWEGSDADGDQLTYYLRYSRDGVDFSPLHTSTQDTSFQVDLAQLPALVNGQGYFELFASDGLNTTVVRSELLSVSGFQGVGGNDPWSNIHSPDSGTSHLQGASVILHGMGWDLEDKAKLGSDIAWSSDVDGALGNGRRTIAQDLTPGNHVISMTVTDSNGAQTTDTTSITVVARDLPNTSSNVCQADLGFAGPGSSALSVCGGDLSTGTSATLSLTGAPSNTTAWLVLGLAATPTPFKGGTLVPVPVLDATAYNTGAGGSVTITPIAGGGGPFSLIVQFGIEDAGQAQGYGFSNAVQVDFLP